MELKEIIESIREKESEGENLIADAESEKRRIIQEAGVEAEGIIKLKEKEAKEQANLIKERVIREAKEKIEEIKKEIEISKDILREKSIKNFDKAVNFIIEELKKT